MHRMSALVVMMLLAGFASAGTLANGNLTLNISHGATLDYSQTFVNAVVWGESFFKWNFTPVAGVDYNYSFAINGKWIRAKDGNVSFPLGGLVIGGNGTSGNASGNISLNGREQFLAYFNTNSSISNTTICFNSTTGFYLLTTMQYFNLTGCNPTSPWEVRLGSAGTGANIEAATAFRAQGATGISTTTSCAQSPQTTLNSVFKGGILTDAQLGINLQTYNIVQRPLESVKTERLSCGDPAFSETYGATEYRDELGQCQMMNFEVPYDALENSPVYLVLNWFSLDHDASRVDWSIQVACQIKCYPRQSFGHPAGLTSYCHDTESPFLAVSYSNNPVCEGVNPGDKVQVLLQRGIGDASSEDAYALVLSMVYSRAKFGAETITGNDR